MLSADLALSYTPTSPALPTSPASTTLSLSLRAGRQLVHAAFSCRPHPCPHRSPPAHLSLSRPGREPRSAALPPAPPALLGSSLRHRARAPFSQRSSSRHLTVLVPPANADSHHSLFASLVVMFSQRRRADPARTPLFSCTSLVHAGAHHPHSHSSLLLHITHPRRRPLHPLAFHSPLASHSSTPAPCSTRPRTTLTRSHSSTLAPFTVCHIVLSWPRTATCAVHAAVPRTAGVPTPLLRATHPLLTRRRTTHIHVRHRTARRRTTRSRARHRSARRRTTHIQVLHTTLHYRTTHSHAPRITACRRRPELLCHHPPPRRRPALDSTPKGRSQVCSSA